MLKNLILSALYSIIIGVCASAHAHEGDKPGSTIPDSRNQIIKLSDQGIFPQTLHMTTEDSILFVLNDTKDSLATLEIDYNGKFTHCASTNLSIIGTDKIRSARPFGPRDFATACFHEKGAYPFKVFGLPKNPAGIAGTILVE